MLRSLFLFFKLLLHEQKIEVVLDEGNHYPGEKEHPIFFFLFFSGMQTFQCI